MSGAVRRFPWPIYIVALVVILLLAAAPLLSALVAGLIADANGCQLDEGSIHPCMINGADWGETLYAMGVLGWLMLLSFPLGLAALAILAIVFALHMSRWSGRERGP